MKFTKFLMAAMAAMAIVSCSKEVETLSPDTPLAPGDARITFAIGSKSTTYASGTEEKAIESMQVFIAYTDASDTRKVIDATSGYKKEGDKNTFSYTFTDGSYKPGAKAMVHFYANSSTITLPADETAIAALTESKDIYSIENPGASNSLKLNGGLTAYQSKEVTLTATALPSETLTLKRMAARLYAVGVDADGKAVSVKGYSVKFTGMASGATFANMNGLDVDGEFPGTDDKYTITGDATGQFTPTGGVAQEAVGYFYPVMNDQSPVTITVTGRDGTTTKATSFLPMPNKNYKLTITPSKDDANSDFDLEIGDWDGNEGDGGNVDFTPHPIQVVPGYDEGGVVLKNGVLEVTPNATNKMSINLNELVTVTGLEDVLLTADVNLTSETTRGLVPGIVEVDNDNLGGVVIDYATIYNKDGLKFFLSVQAAPLNGKEEKLSIPMVIKPHAVFPEGFLVDMGDAGVFPAINTQGTLAADIALFNTVDATSTTGTFSDKLIAYLKTSPANYAALTGKTFTNRNTAVSTGCPKGFKVPTTAEFRGLVANTLNHNTSNFATTGNLTQYNMRGRLRMEPITDGSSATGVVVSEDYKVGVFNSGLTSGNAANKSYRVFDYKGASLVFVVVATSSSFGGVYTVGGNIGFNGNNSSSTLYSENDGTQSGMNVRCIKDDAAANVVW